MLVFSILLITILLMLVRAFYQYEEKSAVPSQSIQADSRPVVILDPGHGGMDSGAVSVFGVEEKDLNLAVAEKLGKFLEAGGVRVLYTRTEDAMLSSERTSSKKMGDLMGRVEFAEKYPEAFFVSIHMNTLPIEKYSGLQVFFEKGNELNHPFALTVQNDAKALLQPENNREVKDAGGKIYVLERIKNPAILVECGFLSNREEAARLADDQYQNKLAYTLSRSILNFALTEKNEEF